MTADTEFTPGPDHARSLRDALGRFATGVTVVTTHGPHGPVGLTANSFAAVSLDPALVLWSPAKTSRRFGAFAHARFFAVHVLAEDQMDLCRHFTQADNHFAGLDMTTSPEGTPLIGGTLARFECATEATHDAGDHLIIIGRVLRACYRDGAPLIFSRGRYGGFQTLP
ncbi:MAG: flavin reductase [Rhodobacteraceae bacterium]|nr:flavin reductase [Paracoccaceae bacterium]